jgi:ABC-type dipeptide/oligopeptide/nickel transport system permease component
MTRYILGRLLQLVPVLWLISTIIFVVMHMLPGDPAELMLAGAEGGAITPQRLAELKREMGLDDPLIVQYLRFLADAAVGDLGTSVRFRLPVSELIADRFGSTLALSLAGLAISVAVGVPLGMIAAVRQNSAADAFTMALSYVGASMPVYWLGLLLILFFSFNLGWFPPAGADDWRSLVLPATTIGLVAAGLIARLVRSSMIEVLREDGAVAPRAQERHDPRDHHDRPAVRWHARGRGRHRDRVQPSRRRPAGRQRDPLEGLSPGAGLRHLPRLRLSRGQSGGRHRLCVARPSDPVRALTP